MIYIFDLDGTLLNTIDADYQNAKPIKTRVEKVIDLWEEGHTIVIETARGDVFTDLTKKQLKDYGIPYHGLSVGKKTFGHVYVDDKGENARDFFND